MKSFFISFILSFLIGRWVHVAGTYNSKTTQAKAYIDGVLRNQSIGNGELSRDWDTKVRIGNGINMCGAEPCKRPLKGSIDEFRIYNYALTPDEIHALVGACKNDDQATRSNVADTKKGIQIYGYFCLNLRVVLTRSIIPVFKIFNFSFLFRSYSSNFFSFLIYSWGETKHYTRWTSRTTKEKCTSRLIDRQTLM